ncbi:hypothetical protein ABMB44_15100 [Levilactobacillus brevis]
MTELERIAELEKRLKERKRKALAKEYEKLGREFYPVREHQSQAEHDLTKKRRIFLHARFTFPN